MSAHNLTVGRGASADAAASPIMQQEFTELLVHDLRSPLSGLAGCIELIREELPEETLAATHEYFDMCDALVARLSSRMDTLLDATRIVEGAIAVKWSEHLVAAVVSDATSIVAVDLSLLGATLTRRIPGDFYGHFDRMLILRVLENLLSNASRQIALGGCIEITGDATDTDLVLTVRNDGKGIPWEVRGRIFDRYFRVEERLSGTRANRGLGLYFCRLAARAHGGDLTLVSGDDGDVRFELRIPQDGTLP